MYEGLVPKMVMGNGALMMTLRADNKLLKDEIDSLRREICCIYLAQSIQTVCPKREKPKTSNRKS